MCAESLSRSYLWQNCIHPGLDEASKGEGRLSIILWNNFEVKTGEFLRNLLTLSLSLTLFYYFLPRRPSPFFFSVFARRTRNFCNPLSRRPASSYLLCIIGRTAEKREEARQTPFLPPPLWSAAGLPILSYFGTNIMLISHRAPAVSRDTRGCKGSLCRDPLNNFVSENRVRG